MTQDEIIAMLRASCEKDRVDPLQNGFWVIHTPELEAFAKLVAQHEREACAKTCEQHGYDHYCGNVTDKLAETIRARGQA